VDSLGNDYYIGARHVMGSTKISLHQRGICRVALTEKHSHQIGRWLSGSGHQRRMSGLPMSHRLYFQLIF
jgi:hypothetical protein